ncbi:MAG: class I SAM-dependent methyltransferase [Pseudomonadota bacterium]
MNKQHSEWFGHDHVGANTRRDKVRGVFESVAQNYDLMNDIMSIGLHRRWKRQLIRALRPSPSRVLLDVAGGTGDISIGYARAGGPAILLDPNPAMLDRARQRIIDGGHYQNIRLVCGDGESLPLARHRVDLYAISFGLRNITDIPAALAEARRVLRPGGRFFCLEFTTPKSPFLRRTYHTYRRILLPALGRIIARDQESYRYLAQSIDRFMTMDQLRDAMCDAGFTRINYRPLSQGLLALHCGHAP